MGADSGPKTRYLVKMKSSFPFWRDYWATLDGLSPLLAEADRVLRRRAKGNHRLPPLPSINGSQTAAALAACQTWAAGKPPKDSSSRPTVTRRIAKILRPVWAGVVWPRWLSLEQAFFDASTSGDHLFAALTLRTMCEEVQRLRALDLSARKLIELAGSTAEEDCERLHLFFSIVWTSAAKLPNDMFWDGDGWPSLKKTNAEKPELERVRAQLNSYVHPNYGSHITALFPEQSETARLLLEATVTVYNSFFSLSWSEKSIGPGGAHLRLSLPQPWALTSRRFVEHVVPELCRNAEHPMLAEVLGAPSALRWLERDQRDSRAILAQPDIDALLRGLPILHDDVAKTSANPTRALWEGAGPSDFLDLAAARRQEQILTETAPNGIPGTDQQSRWLRFNSLALGLAMLLDRTKVNAFKVQLVRQIVRGNQLGVLLCVRSLIEHRALTTWLPDAIFRSIEKLANNARATSPMLNNETSELEQKLTNFLLVQANQYQGERRPWTTAENGGARNAWLNLRKIVDSAFKDEDGLKRIYALASAALHGRYLRGLELLDFTMNHPLDVGLGVLVLERLCNPDEEMDSTFSAAISASRLDHAALFSGTEQFTSDRMAQQVFGQIDQPLVLGVDYMGNGSLQDPFTFAHHLQFHTAYYAILKQIGVNLADGHQELDFDTDGNLLDKWIAKDREIWFRVTLPSDDSSA